MTRVPLTLVIALFLIGTANWPSVAAWAEETNLHHALVHGLLLIAGSLFGLQTAWWMHLNESETWAAQQEEEGEVTS
ncbi:hypothetical protein [Alicyclobacillus suci]|uniref:hypothetical protein n=1 Tax=Alicyclobacillus suci TaxID=2816080 RepID=UPI001A8D509C|nr:hypothetical protein [Alicyclobacillus suci]